MIIKLGCCRLFDRFYRINPNAVKANPFGVRLPAADIFASIEELKVLIQCTDKISVCAMAGFSQLKMSVFTCIPNSIET